MYSNGKSEKIVATALKKYAIPRSKVQILTKIFTFTDDENTVDLGSGMNPKNCSELSNFMGLSRTAIIYQVEGCLRRLDTDYIDILQIHRFDPATPIEETMQALNDLVRSGKVRYIGASSMFTYQFAMMQACAEKNGWAKFVSMQCQYSLLYREEEREMIKYCEHTGVGIIPYSPLAGGAIARSSDVSTIRSEILPMLVKIAPIYYDLSEGDAAATILNRVQELAEKKSHSRAQIGLSWIISKVASPIVGISSVNRLEEAVSAGHMSLDDEETKFLEEPYIARRIFGLA